MLPAVEIKTRDQQVIEQALPAHLMFLMMEECQKRGITLRSDVMHRLNMAAAVPFSGIDELSVSRLAKRTDDIARSLLHDLSPDDPLHGLYTCVVFTLRLVDEGFLEDKGNMAVLVALLLMSDLEDEAPGDDGDVALVHDRRLKWQTGAGSMHTRAALQGVYNIRLRN